SDDNVENAVAKTVPNKFVGATLSAGVDYYGESATFESAQTEIKNAIQYLSSNGYNTVYVNVNFNGGVIFDCEFIENTTGGDLLTFINQTAHESGMIVVTSVDVGALAKTDIISAEDISLIKNILASSSLIHSSDAILLKGYCLPKDAITYNDYLANSGGIGYAQYQQNKLTSVMKQFSEVISKANSSLYTGILCDPVWATASQKSGGIDVSSNGFSALTDGSADTLSWLKNDIFDYAVVNNNYSTVTDSDPFNKTAKWWCENIGDSADVAFMLSSSLVNSGTSSWASPDQLAKQLMALSNLNTQGIVFDSYAALFSDTSGSTNAVNKYLTGSITNDYVLKDLSLTTPSKTVYTTNESYVTFIGATDPQFEASLNGSPLERNELGYFSLTFDLKLGVNKFSFVHKGKTIDYSITYKKVIIKSISPATNLKLDGGMPFGVTVVALSNSKVTATLNGETITLSEKKELDASGAQVSEYSSYSGIFYLPASKTSVQKLGAVKFKVASTFGTETRNGGSVTINKVDVLDDSAITAPIGGNYINVGTSLIAEVTTNQAEVFSGSTTDDWSRPTNNYLPAGTVDYTHRSMVYDSKSGNYYRLLRCNRRLYSDKKGLSDVKIYEGTLPDVNNITCASTEESTRYTTIAFNVDWKAPFLLELNPQNYTNPDQQVYTISAATFSYVDITFCYAASFNGDVKISADNPLFSKAETVKNTADLTLRLYLKKPGAFYGWNAEYNLGGQLVFSFLNPAKISSADNGYGVSLSGVKIHIDAGHGGRDPGAGGNDPNCPESVLNLILAQKLQARLESLGATVSMTRTGNYTVGNEERMNIVRNEKPDFTIAIHRNSNEKSGPSGYEVDHFAPFSYNATKYIYNDFSAAGLFPQTKWTGIKWHYYYLGRVSVCPVVLIECGYMSNDSDYTNIRNDNFNNRSADALTQGIVQYFKSIQ
ncbi:MAG: N-acetylmuramoyl-L-alanine amidase, partial [Oscillospiraceae bacterium]|nr:N-acetylmuramoyl-L-alanine amidase [Oscillospiraceae bacterium]